MHRVCFPSLIFRLLMSVCIVTVTMPQDKNDRWNFPLHLTPIVRAKIFSLVVFCAWLYWCLGRYPPAPGQPRHMGVKDLMHALETAGYILLNLYLSAFSGLRVSVVAIAWPSQLCFSDSFFFFFFYVRI